MNKRLSYVYDMVFLPKEALLFKNCRNIWGAFYALFTAFLFYYLSASPAWFVQRFFLLGVLALFTYFFYILCLDGLAQFFGAKGQLWAISPWWLFSFSPFLLMPLFSSVFSLPVFSSLSVLFILVGIFYSLWYQSLLLNHFYGFKGLKSFLIVCVSVTIFFLGSFCVWGVFLFAIGPSLMEGLRF